jgi:hypothetical protein
MGYRVISFRGEDSDTREFKEAAKMAKEGVERMCELADEMRDKYSERSYYGDRYGMRGSYGRRDHEMWDDDDMYGERRRRDSRGRYM